MKWRHVLIATGILGIAACSRTTKVQEVSVNPSTAAVPLGKSLQFTNRGFAAATWLVIAPPGHGIISPSGLYHAPFFIPADPTVTIEARVGARSARAQIQLLDQPTTREDCQGDSVDGYMDELPEVITRVPPEYPALAREAGVEGTVLIQARVCDCGLIDSTMVVQSIPMLDEAAVVAIRQWVFVPAKSSGVPIAVWVAIPVRFSLDAPGSVPVGPFVVSAPPRPRS